MISKRIPKRTYSTKVVFCGFAEVEFLLLSPFVMFLPLHLAGRRRMDSPSPAGFLPRFPPIREFLSVFFFHPVEFFC